MLIKFHIIPTAQDILSQCQAHINKTSTVKYQYPYNIGTGCSKHNVAEYPWMRQNCGFYIDYMGLYGFNSHSNCKSLRLLNVFLFFIFLEYHLLSSGFLLTTTWCFMQFLMSRIVLKAWNGSSMAIIHSMPVLYQDFAEPGLIQHYCYYIRLLDLITLIKLNKYGTHYMHSHCFWCHNLLKNLF